MEISDAKLVSLCKNKDSHGFNLLYTKYEKYIYRLCYYYTDSKEDSLDLLQEIYIKIYKSIHSFDETKPLSPWIKRITLNTCQNYIRDCRKPVVSLNTSLPHEDCEYEAFLASESNVEEEMDYRSTKDALEMAIKELPNTIKSVVILRHIENMNYNQISDFLSIPIGTVKTYLFRGRTMLKAKLKKAGVWEV